MKTCLAVQDVSFFNERPQTLAIQKRMKRESKLVNLCQAIAVP